LQSVVRNEKKKSALPDSVSEPTPEGATIEEEIVKTNSVKVRVVQKSLFVEFLVKNSEPNNGNGREGHIVEHV